MSMIMFATLMIIIFMYVFSILYQDNLKDKKKIIFEDFAYSIQNEIIVAAEAKPGYRRTFQLPDKLEGFDYEINILNSTLSVNYTGESFVLPIPSIKGNLKKGPNVIENKNASIIVNP